MANSPVDVLNAVTRSRGKEPIDAYKIEGFDTPVRTDGPFGEDDDELPPEMPQSPLVPPSVTSLGTTLENPTIPERQVAVPAPALAVLNTKAHFQGTDVELDEQAFNEIATIVLRSAVRSAQNKMAALAGPRVESAPAKRRPGRPVGSGDKQPRKRRRHAPAVDPAQTP